jgi:hypothetical protein
LRASRSIADGFAKRNRGSSKGISHKKLEANVCTSPPVGTLPNRSPYSLQVVGMVLYRCEADADHDTLATYILTLLDNDKPRETLKSDCRNRLQEFLDESKNVFLFYSSFIPLSWKKTSTDPSSNQNKLEN